MAIDYARLKDWASPAFEQRYGEDYTFLYALAVGLGGDAWDARQLPFVYEHAQPSALPTMALVLGDPGFWLQDPATGIDWPHVLYGEVSIELHASLPVRGDVRGTTHIDDIIDKGPGKGAILYARREVTERTSGRALCTVRSTYICRADGGFGGPARRTPTPHPLPARAPDERVELTTLPQSALLYRLTGDRNPLHADPDVARQAGFQRPILHGLCSFGVAGHALLRALCGYEAERVRTMSARFVAPVYPGDGLVTEIWHEGPGQAAFRCCVPGRDGPVLSNGRFTFA